MKLILILLSVVASFSSFGNLRRKWFDNHHFSRKNLRQASRKLVLSHNVWPLKMSNKAEKVASKPVVYDAAVINQLLQHCIHCSNIAIRVRKIQVPLDQTGNGEQAGKFFLMSKY